MYYFNTTYNDVVKEISIQVTSDYWHESHLVDMNVIPLHVSQLLRDYNPFYH